MTQVNGSDFYVNGKPTALPRITSGDMDSGLKVHHFLGGFLVNRRILHNIFL
jgi:hypothetical protein